MKKSLIILALLSGLVCAGRGTSAACETVHLGAALSLTGKYAINGALAKKAYEFTVDRINADGGLQLAGQCHHLQLKLYDDESKADRGATLTERLINQDQVQFVLGPYSSALTAAIAPVTEKYKVPMVEGLGASRSLFNKGWQYLFAVVSTSEKYLAATIDLAAEIANASGKQASDVRLAIVVENDPFSLDVRAGIVEQAGKYGMQIIIDDKMPRDLTDLSSTLTKVKLLKPDLLLVSGHSKGAVTATRQLAEKGIQVPMVAMTQCESAGIIEKFGAAAEGILCSSQWDETLTYEDRLFGSAKEFAAAFKAQHPEFNGVELPYQVASAAAAVIALADAIERAGSMDREAVRQALRHTDLQSFYGHLKFAPEGNNVGKPVFLRQIQEGKFVVVAPNQFANGALNWPRKRSK